MTARYSAGFFEGVGGARLFYERWIPEGGSGPGEESSDFSRVIHPKTVVLCDGIGCDGFVWRHLTAPIAEHFPVVHWHYPGHGRSGPIDADRISIELLSGNLHRLMDHLELERPVLLGHSMGTQVVLESLRAQPDRVGGLVLANGSFGRITDTFHDTEVLKNALPELLRAAEKHPYMARALWGRIPPKLAFRAASRLGEIDRRHMREEDFTLYWEHINLISPEVFLNLLRRAGEHTAEDLLSSIAVPCLVVAGELDMFIPAKVVRNMALQIPHARYLELVGASHAGLAEQPDNVLEELIPFLERVSSRPQPT